MALVSDARDIEFVRSLNYEILLREERRTLEAFERGRRTFSGANHGSSNMLLIEALFLGSI